MAELGLPVRPEFIVEGDHKPEGGERALQTLVALKECPTALLCSNDMTAIGVMRAAYELHIEVPKDLSVVGFDDIMFAEQWPAPFRRHLPTIICQHLCASAPSLGENWDGNRRQPRITGTTSRSNIPTPIG